MSECLCPCYVCGEMEPLESMKFHNGFCSCDSVDGCTHGVCKDCVQECSDQETACEICMGESGEIDDCEECCRPVCRVCSEDVGGSVVCQACMGGTDLIEKLQSENAALRAQVERLEEELAEQYWETVGYGGSYDQETGVFNSCALSGVAWAMNRLVELGQAEAVGDQSGRVIEIRRAAVLRETEGA